MRNILLAIVVLAALLMPQISFADKAVDKYQQMTGVQVVTDSNVDVTYTGKHWKEDGEDKYEYIARIHQAPIYNEDGSLVDCSWHGSEDAWVIVDNVFSAQVIGSYITVTYQGKSMSWNPVVMIDSKEYVAKGSPKVINDPINENYRNNVLEWDYGVCVRRVRVIEGLIQETWTFDKDPKGNVWIRDHAQTQQGFTWAIEPYGYDADGNPIAVNEYKQVSASVMASAKYPVTIDPTEVFVTSASDGFVYKEDFAYATAQGAATGTVSAAADYFAVGQYKSAFYYVYRGFVYFDTSSIPDGATISAANLSLRGKYDYSTTNFDITVQEGMPTYPHDPLATGDYDKTHYAGSGGTFGTAGFSTSGYNNLSLDATGMGWIDVTGTTKFCLRSSRDISITAPTGNEHIHIYSYEKGDGYRPTLYVTYVSSGPPDVTTQAATYVTKTSARVNGYLDSDGGEATTVWFNYWEWYDQNWSDCIEFSINASYVDSDLTNFPVLITGAQVNESNPNFWTTVDVNGSDILFTDVDGNKLNRELVSIDTTNMSMECYVNVTTIDDTLDTPIYMYYGSSNVSLYNESNSTDTWDVNYVLVYHLNDDPDTSTVQDSTINGNDGNKGGAGAPAETDGYFSGDEGQQFDGTNKYMLSDNTADSPDALTAEILWKRSGDSGGATSDIYHWLLSSLNGYTTNRNCVQVSKDGTAVSGQLTTNAVARTSTSVTITAGDYHLVGITWDGTLIYTIADGTISGGISAPGALSGGAAPINIGRYDATTYLTNGIESEIRISNVSRSADWIESTYYSLMEPELFCPVTDVFHETATQSKNTGDSFYNSLTGLTANTLYGFRAMGTQTQGTDYGNWLFFDTTVTLGAPSNVTCSPDSNSITLSWVKGGNTSYTYIRYKTGGYPTGTADGNAIALQSGVDYVHTGLTSGVTYYYKMWGEDAGDYSATNSTTACTTYAGYSEGTPVPLPTVDTSDWSETPNGSVLENNPLYALGNLEADEVGVPHNTWWMLIGLGILVSGGLFIYSRTRDTVATIGGIIIFGVIMAQMGLFPIWTMILFGLVGIGFGWKGLR